MGVKCNIIRDNKGNIETVLTPDGNESILFKNILNYLNKSTKTFIENKSNKEGEYLFEDNGASVTASVTASGNVEIKLLESKERGKGNARTLMQQVLNYFDNQNITTYLYAAPRDSTTDVDGLINFYKSLGFNSSRYFPEEMTRTPKRVKNIITNDLKQKALDLWTVAYTDSFIEDNYFEENQEPSLEELLNYIKLLNNENKDLTKKDINDLSNNLLVLPYTLDEVYTKLKTVFYRRGFFEINKEFINNSDLYNNSEKLEILTNPIIQNNIKNLIEKMDVLLLNNEEAINIENISFINEDEVLQNIDNLIGIGKFENLNPFEVDNIVAEYLAEETNREIFNEKVNDLPYPYLIEKYNSDIEFANKFFNKFSNLKKINVVRVNNGVLQLVNKSDTEGTISEVLLTNVNDVTIMDDSLFLNQIPEDIWLEEGENIKGILKNFEEKLINYNIDIIGISELYDEKTREDIIIFINSLSEFTNQIDNNEEIDLQELSSIIDNFFNNDVTNKYVFDNITGLNKNLSLFKIISEQTELELFSNYGLIKTYNSFYQKINVEPNIDTLYQQVYELVLDNNNILPNEAYYPTAYSVNNNLNINKLNNLANQDLIKRDIKSYVLKNTSKYNLEKDSLNIENLEKLVLYKLLFKHPINVSENIDFNQEINKFNLFNGNFDYLTTNFLSDFNNYVLKEKFKNSEIYNNVLQYFSIDERGIYLKNDDVLTKQKINLLSLDNKMFNNLRQYVLISKEQSLQDIFEISNDGLLVNSEGFERIYYSNNPQMVKSYKGEYSLQDDVMVIDKNNNNFIKVDDLLYEKVQEQNGLSFYKNIPILNNNYFKNYGTKINVKKNVDFEKFNKFIKIPSNIFVLDNLYSKNELISIKEEIDECG